MRKQLQRSDEHTSCDVCHRTLLKGELAEPYLTPSRERRLVCSLCAPRAQRESWIRESVAPETPTRPARDSRRQRWFRLGRRLRERNEAVAARSDTSAATGSAQSGEIDLERLAANSEPEDGSHHLRDVRAVPTNAQLKLDRAIEVFNESEHPRTVAGIARTLGAPSVSATCSASSSAEVILTLGWELAWYQYAVDLSDRSEPVQLRARGEDLDELPDEARQWNAVAAENGSLRLASLRTGS